MTVRSVPLVIWLAIVAGCAAEPIDSEEAALHDAIASSQTELSVAWVAGGEVPTCNTCACDGCVRGLVDGVDRVRLKLRPEGEWLDGSMAYRVASSSEVVPYVVVGLGSPSAPDDYELVPIEPGAVLSSYQSISVPARFRGSDVSLWFATYAAKGARLLPPSSLRR